MTACETCRREGWTFHVTGVDGTDHDFDSVACIIDLLAVRCDYCHALILARPHRMTNGVFCSPECTQRAFTRASWDAGPGDAEPDAVGSTPPRFGMPPTALPSPTLPQPRSRPRQVARNSQMPPD